MRVTGGAYRGRALSAPSGNATRPTTDKVREALFSILGPIGDAKVADLFAGSGSLGFEALSRGAASVCFVEVALAPRRALTKNATALQVLDRVQVLPLDVAKAGRALGAAGPFDLVFCDPPWTRFAESLKALARLPWFEIMGEFGILCLEHPTRERLEPSQFAPLRFRERRHWGDTAVSIWELGGEPSEGGEAPVASR